MGGGAGHGEITYHDLLRSRVRALVLSGAIGEAVQVWLTLLLVGLLFACQHQAIAMARYAAR